MARVPYRDGDDLPEEYGAVFETTRTGATHLFGALANNPPVLDAFVGYSRTLWDESGLDDIEREVVVLTVARQTHADYEWHQHAPLALEAGLDEEAVAAIREGRYPDLTPRLEALATYAAGVATGNVDDAIHRTLAERVDDRTLVGTAMLAATYTGLARFLDALAVGPEDSFVGWGLDGFDEPEGGMAPPEELADE